MSSNDEEIHYTLSLKPPDSAAIGAGIDRFAISQPQLPASDKWGMGEKAAGGQQERSNAPVAGLVGSALE